MPFFRYSQNNSGGSFVPPYHHIVIEAPQYRSANALAEETGLIYFDGCDSGLDCECCGDRWHRASSYDADPEPMIYSEPVETYRGLSVWKEAPKWLVVYADGTRREGNLTAA